MGLSRGALVQVILRGAYQWALAGRERRTVAETGGVLSPSSESTGRQRLNLSKMGALCVEAPVRVHGAWALPKSIGASPD